MRAEFNMTLTINDEDVEVEVEYGATSYSDGPEIDFISVTLDGEKLNTTPEQDKAILDACFDRVDDDLQGEADAEGDYRYDLSRDYDD